MCGIAGIINLNNKIVDTADLKKMIASMKHRGPDGDGVFIDDNVGLAHMRLSIIDLSPLAHQPMCYQDKNYWIVHNGEVYNYIELREELEKEGYQFKSTSDTEVILASYIRWGESCVNKFNGMWAFAIYDKNSKKLFAGRDRFGVKPFYYYKDKDVFIFASEIKAILKIMPQLKNPDYPYLYYFLNSGTIDDGEETFFNDIKQLRPAHCLLLQRDEFKIYKYWDYYETSAEKYSYKDPSETFLALLNDSIKLRLRSDVPVGTCLSGGLDSSAIVTLSSRMTDEKMHTFSSIYEDKDCDESYYMDMVNKFNETVPHHVMPEPDEFFSVLKKAVYHQDEPTSAPGIYSQWNVMKIARDYVKVLLDGQGADELICGYFYFFEHYLSSVKQDAQKNGVIKTAFKLLNEYPKIRALTNINFHGGKTKLIKDMLIPRLIIKWLGIPKPAFLKKKKQSMYQPEFLETAGKNPVKRNNAKKFKNDLNNASYMSIFYTSLPALLHYEDRNSMAFSIEARVPFLDYRLVEFCLGLPYEEKINGDTTKAVMRKALKGILPDEITNRRDKKGYPTPFARWLRQDLKEGTAEILFSDKARSRNIFNIDYMKKEFNRHVKGEIDISWQIWRYLTTEMWFEEFID